MKKSKQEVTKVVSLLKLEENLQGVGNPLKRRYCCSKSDED